MEDKERGIVTTVSALQYLWLRDGLQNINHKKAPNLPHFVAQHCKFKTILTVRFNMW